MEHQIRFHSSEEMHRHGTFLHTFDDGGKGLDDDVKHSFSKASTISGQDMHSRSSSHGISNAITPGSSHLRKIARRNRKSVDLSDQGSCEDSIAVAKPEFEVDQG